MFTYQMANLIIDTSIEEPEFLDFFILTLTCILTVPIDLILLPLELLAGIMLYLHKKRRKEEKWNTIVNIVEKVE